MCKHVYKKSIDLLTALAFFNCSSSDDVEKAFIPHDQQQPTVEVESSEEPQPIVELKPVVEPQPIVVHNEGEFSWNTAMTHS